MASVRGLGAAVIAHFDHLSETNLLPYLPQELARVPRANIVFQPIKEAWFSGSMNYIGRARNADGSPQYEANYEINAALRISYPEFEQLVSHEVVPGHVTTFAYLQDLYVRGMAGFEATVLTMNTRAATLFEGIANNAILIAHGVTEARGICAIRDDGYWILPGSFGAILDSAHRGGHDLSPPPNSGRGAGRERMGDEWRGRTCRAFLQRSRPVAVCRRGSQRGNEQRGGNESGREKRTCFTGRLWLSLRGGKIRRGVRALSVGIRPQRTRLRAGTLGRIPSGTSVTAAVRFGLTWMPRLPWRS